MARTLRDAKLDTRSRRAKLKARREPYWRSISEGLAIGFRKGAKGGTWIARHYSPTTADASRPSAQPTTWPMLTASTSCPLPKPRPRVGGGSPT